ncbi:MAG: NUDIX hydrolase [Candidatus Cryptobacteroides sp.]
MTVKGTYTYDYPRPAVTTDCVIFGYDGKELKVLLIERGIEPFKGCWAFPGGFLNMDEDALAGARRELKEETGLENAFIEQFHTFSEPGRDPRGRVITIAHYALVKIQEVEGGDDAAQARWFPIGEVPPLAFDHDRILRMAMSRLKEKIHFEPVGFELLPDVFTMPQLQNLYEAILEVHFDRRNFASKMLKLGILEDTGDRPAGASSRIPVSYRFNKEKYNELKAKGFRLEF